MFDCLPQVLKVGLFFVFILGMEGKSVMNLMVFLL